MRLHLHTEACLAKARESVKIALARIEHVREMGLRELENEASDGEGELRGDNQKDAR